jgi:hypothetical protein
MLIPLGVFYVRAVAATPFLYACNPMRGVCVFVHAPFVLGVAACCIGYYVGRPTVDARHVV